MTICFNSTPSNVGCALSIRTDKETDVSACHFGYAVARWKWIQSSVEIDIEL
ncbi:MAG: hypothetical protein J6F30_05980 [Cellulosilyticum sp.]|nr:hypothetical protein [Cellulosilyticum sp.]